MSKDPENGTPSPPPDEDSPKPSDESLKESPKNAQKADAADSSGSDAAPRKDNADEKAGSGEENEASSPEDTKAPPSPEPESNSEDTVEEKTEDANSKSGEEDEKDDDGEVKPTKDSSHRAGKDPASDHEDEHNWHDEHEDYHPEYDDPYQDEYDDTYHYDGDEHYYHDHDDEHHHDEEHHDEEHSHSSGHSIAPAASLPESRATTASKKTAVTKKEDDWDDWDDDEDEEGGGPVKSFLEHLEDLRWVIIKCAVAVLVCMCVCLVAADKALDVLLSPLEDAKDAVAESMIAAAEKEGKIKPTLQLQFGSDHLETEVDTNVFEMFGGKFHVTNNMVALRAVPKRTADGFVLGLEPTGEHRKRKPPIQLPQLSPRSPLTPFMLALKTAFFGGMGLASPFVLFFIAQFVVPALHRHEKKYLGWGIVIGSGLFALGVVFAYVVIAKMMLMASVTFTEWLGFSSNIWIIDEYIGVMLKLLFGVGVGFELPVVLLTLVRIGILDYPKLAALRMYAIVAILVISALLTPPDVISQVMMSLPLFVLYEISVQISRVWYRKEQKEAPEETDSAGKESA